MNFDDMNFDDFFKFYKNENKLDEHNIINNLDNKQKIKKQNNIINNDEQKIKNQINLLKKQLNDEKKKLLDIKNIKKIEKNKKKSEYASNIIKMISEKKRLKREKKERNKKLRDERNKLKREEKKKLRKKDDKLYIKNDDEYVPCDIKITISGYKNGKFYKRKNNKEIYISVNIKKGIHQKKFNFEEFKKLTSLLNDDECKSEFITVVYHLSSGLVAIGEEVKETLNNNELRFKIVKHEDKEINKDISDIESTNINQSTINNIFISNVFSYDPITLDYKITQENIMNSYLLDNQRGNACFYDIIINTYKDKIENKSTNGKAYKFILDYENLFNLFNPDCNNEEEFEKNINCPLPLTFKKAVIFFEKFKIDLIVINPNNKVIFEYYNKIKNSNIKPNVLKLIYHNNHVFKIDDKYEEDTIINAYANQNDLEVSNNYYLSNEQDKEFIVLNDNNNIKEMVKYIFECLNNSKKDNINFIYDNNNLKELAYIIIDDYKHNPSVIINKGCIIMIKSTLIRKKDNKTINFIIKKPLNDLKHIIDGKKITTNEYYELYNKYQEKIYLHFINNKNKSYYNDETLNILNQYFPTIQYGELKNIHVSKNNIAYFDFTKAYTSNLMDLEYLPVINFAERFRNYDNHEIQDYNTYLIEILSKDDIFNTNYTNIYGFNLKKLKLKYKIIKYLEPSYLNKNNCKALIKELYESELDIQYKKFIMNNTLGNTGKKYNKKNVTIICNNYETAYIHKKSNDNKGYIIDMDDGKFYYIRSNKAVLKNGFLPINMAIYDTMRMKLYELKNNLINNGVEIVGYKVDAIYFNKNHKNIFDIIEKYETYDDNKSDFENIGKLTYNDIEIKLCGNIVYKKIEYIDDGIKEYLPINNIDIKDEYMPSFENIVNKTIILGDAPGCGKSTLCLNYAIQSKKNYIIVTPYNKTINDINSNIKILSNNKSKNFEVMTFHNFFGMDIYQKVINKNKDVKYKDVELVIFEEIYTMHSILLINIYKFMLKYPNIMIIANGDLYQLEPVMEILKNKKRQELINYLFPNQVTLKISKRFKDDKRVKAIKNLMKKFSDTNEEKAAIDYIVNDLFKEQQIKNINEVDTYDNISYRNDTKNYINEIIHKKILLKNKRKYYYAGLMLVCRIKLEYEKQIFCVNQEYKIKFVENDKIKLINNDVIVTLDIEIIKKYFALPYCYTCHSCQGVTIENKYTIFDYNSPFVNLRWIYVAITRCTDINNVYFYTGDIDLKKYELQKKVKNIMNDMIISYKNQDKKAQRDINDDYYINVDWMIKQMKKQLCKCYYCHNVIDIGIDKNDNLLTVDRIENKISHNKNNCVLSCWHCNVSKK